MKGGGEEDDDLQISVSLLHAANPFLSLSLSPPGFGPKHGMTTLTWNPSVCAAKPAYFFAGTYFLRLRPKEREREISPR